MGDARAAVERITASRAFRGLDRLSHFLRFVVQESIDGRADQIKEYVIGLEVYQKDASGYDPRTDSTVRVEAAKLRSKLTRYYETEGQADPVVISIPKGTYAPVLEAKPAAAKPTGRKPIRLMAMACALSVVTAAVLWLGLRSAPKTPPPPRMVPLTSFQGSEFRPSLSPDASQVAFSWNGEQQQDYDIYVMMTDGGPPRRLTETPGWEGAPAWSPDGRQIAFLRAGAVFLISPMGGPERKLAEAKNSPIAWTPDGMHVAMTDPRLERTPPGILLVSVTTGKNRLLTAPPQKSKGDSHPAFSPRGQTLAFVRWLAAGYSLCLSAVAGGEPRCRPAETGEIAGITWTPDGEELVFSSTRGGGRQLWRIPAGSGFSGEPRLVTGAGENASYPVIAGARLAYQRVLHDVNIWRMEPSAGTSNGRPTRIVGSTRWDTGAQYSPDGNRIAFVSDRTGDFEIWMCDREAKTFVQLTSLRGPSTGSPSWSPDGRLIAFDSAAAGSGDIYVVGLDGVSLRRLTTEETTEEAPSWSSDGRTLYFRSDRSGDEQIWKMPAEGGAAVQVTYGGGVDAMESLDGRWLYYVKSRERGGLWRVSTEAGRQKPAVAGGNLPLLLRRRWHVPTEGGEDMLLLDSVWRGLWAVAAKGIYFVYFAPGAAGGEIRFLDPETNSIATVGRIEKADFREHQSFSVTRDGRWILYSQADHFDADLVLLDHFR